MALEIKLNQKLSQSLVMTPQLQQAIKLLQLGRLEYLEVIEKELLENPVLEDAADSDEPRAVETNGEVNGTGAPDPIESAPTNVESQNFETGTRPENAEGLGGLEWAEYYENYSDPGMVSTGKRNVTDDDRPSLEATVSKPEGLVSHILWQLRTSELQRDDHDIALQTLGNLDRNGYLSCTVEELAEMCMRPVEDVQRVLKVMHTFDPPGIAACDLRECLLIQLEQIGLGDSLSARIVSEHLSKLEIRRYDLIARAEGVPVEEVYEAVKEIQKLEPRPGRPFIDEAPIYITPDIYVRKVGEDYVISLNEAGMPKLRLNSHYRELLTNGKGQDPAYREYLQDRLRAAAWLIKSVHQRQQTIYKVTESIMKFQREFLEQGVTALRPLVLRDVAEDVSMHESTVSRVTTNKYVHTAQGVYELKFFFTSGLKSGAGEVSSESVKDRIKGMIAGEDPRHPLSDQAIVNVLRSEGVDIARRTVAKYREMMNVLSSSRRKKVF